jgi:5,10-methylenetetrahydromethanopterin reductase
LSDLGVSIEGRAPIAEIPAQARAAEAGGAATLWMACHLYLRDPITTAALALSATRRVKVALMAMSPYAVHPVFLAMAAASLDEMFPGRVILSLGAGAPADLAAARVRSERPLVALRETVALCRALFSGETVEFEGDMFGSHGRRLVNAPRNIPIVLAASRPRMLALSGRIADGVLISAAACPEFVRASIEIASRRASQSTEVSWPAERRACSPHERSDMRDPDFAALIRTTGSPAYADDDAVQTPGEFRKYAIVYTCLAADERHALDRMRRTLAFVLRGAHHAENLRLSGAALDQKALAAAYAAENWVEVERLVSDDVVRRHAACGSAAQVRQKFDEYRATGLDEVIVGGIDDAAGIAAVLAAARGQHA